MKNKICISTLILFTIIMITSFVQAATPPEDFNWTGDDQGEVATTTINDCWILCIQKGGQLKNTTYVGSVTANNPVTTINRCPDSTPSAYWAGDKYQSYFKQGSVLSPTENQDALYALINAEDIDEAQRILWALDINEGKHVDYDSELMRKSKIYGEFYKKMQAAGGYKPKDITDYSKVKVYVNQEDGTYTAGPFQIEYLDDNYNNYELRFGEIQGTNSKNGIKVKNEQGTELNVVDILDTNGNSTFTRGIHNDYVYPVSKEKFYVKFKSNNPGGIDAGKYVTLDVSFNYLKECTGTLTSYDGKVYRWRWAITRTDHEKTCNSGTEENACSHGHHSSHTYVDHRDGKYELNRYNKGDAQRLLAWSFDGEEIWDTAKLEMIAKIPGKPNGIDITMDLAGYVFLDADSGKINEGNNVLDGGETLQGVEVTLFDGNGVVTTSSVHHHEGNPIDGTGCFTQPVYHVHTKEAGCYSTGHVHQGDSTNGGACYTPVYHTWHGEDCHLYCNNTDPDHIHTHPDCYKYEYKLVCKKTEHKHSPGSCKYYCGLEEHSHSDSCYDENGNKTCGKHAHTHGNDECVDNCRISEHKHTPKNQENGCYEEVVYCGKNSNSIDCYKLNCNLDTSDKLTCKKTEKTIDYYVAACNQDCSTGTSSGYTKVKNPVITKSDGKYEFKSLDPMKKYYVRFAYNGMLYINVASVNPLTNNAINVSKSSEQAQGHGDNRENFNNKFSEIGTYPTNYGSPSKGGWNKTFPQDEVKGTIQSAIIAGDSYSPSTDEEYFAKDCKIFAFSEQQYPLFKKFVIDFVDRTLFGVEYPGIYKSGGKADQLHINLGIKCRPTFDLALYKDVQKAQVMINGKTETYYYDSRKASATGDSLFGFGVNESDYLTSIRQAYIDNSDYTFDKTRQPYTNEGSRDMEQDDYDMLIRTEEAANGNSGKYNIGDNEEVPNNFQLKDNYELSGDDRLKIYVTYKIRVKNQSSVTGGITELVDYYDKNYTFTNAYVGNDEGERIGDVTASLNSQYDNRGNNSYEDSNKYKTIYLIPNNVAWLNNNEQQYIYVTLQLLGETQNDAGTLLTQKLVYDKQNLYTLNLVEINGYTTNESSNGREGTGVLDKDSTPGNLDMRGITAFADEYVKNVTPYEDDTNRAPAYVYKLMTSRTMEGTVFEDNTGLDEKVYSGETRAGNGEIDDTDTMVKDVTVQLVEIKNGKMYIRSETKTNENGWYGFTGFVPGDYTIRYIYGHDNDTVIKIDNPDTPEKDERTYFADESYKEYYKGSNQKSYNGQDFQSTHYQYDLKLENQYQFDRVDQNMETGVAGMEYWNETNRAENVPQFSEDGTNTDIYWYSGTEGMVNSDAYDNHVRRNEVIEYSSNTYERQDDTKGRTGTNASIVNYKAEVFNSYQEESYYGTGYYNYFPTMNDELHASLVEELKANTYRYAYTPQMSIEVEKATTKKDSYKNKGKYAHVIKGIDFGIVERPKAELTIDQDIDGVKLVLANGSTLIDTKKGASNNVQMPKNGLIHVFDTGERYRIQVDDELLSGATLQVTYNITLTNNSEIDADGYPTIDTITQGTIAAKNIVNYVPNNMTFEENDNNGLNGEYWRVTSVNNIQNNNESTLVNSRNVADKIDISTQSTILMATDENPLVTATLYPANYANGNASDNAHLEDASITNRGEAQVTAQLTLKKLISAESYADDMEFYNITEVVEYDNGVGRYDHGAIPGNQNPDLSRVVNDDLAASDVGNDYAESYKVRFAAFNFEHDASGGKDGEIIITPPTGGVHIYYVLIAGAILMLAGGVILIKKKVLDK